MDSMKPKRNIIEAHKAAVLTTRYNHSGDKLLTGGEDMVNVIRCWQQGDGIVSGGSDCFVRVWDPCSSESRQSNVLSLCTTSNNNILAGCFDGTVREIDHRHLRRASDTEILHKYKGHQCRGQASFGRELKIVRIRIDSCYQYGDSPRPQPKRLNGNCLGERQGFRMLIFTVRASA
ncbi:WD40 repeat [Tanacetum coccineum]